MEDVMVLCDTNIFIEFYKNNTEIIEKLNVIGTENIALSAVTYGELLFGAINKPELKKIKDGLETLIILPLSISISEEFLSLMTKYSLSHRITLPDALIAATAIAHSIPLYTLNVKDFRFIKNINLLQ